MDSSADDLSRSSCRPGTKCCGARRVQGQFSYAAVELGDGALLSTTLTDFKPDAIINPGGMTDVDGCERDPGAAYEANVAGVASLAKVARSTGAHLVHLSTDYVFDGENWSRSRKGTLRGLHLQHPKAQGKLVMVTRGSVFDVAVDVRRGSPHFGKWVGYDLSEENKRQLWIPPGFAHGFCVTSDECDFLYKCTEIYAPENERTVLWNDPAIGVQWPTTTPLLSKKDEAGLALEQHTQLPEYRG